MLDHSGLASASQPHLLWTCGRDGGCDYVDEHWVEVTGVPAADQLGYGWIERVHPEDRSALLDAWNAALVTGRDFVGEFRLRRYDGEYRWFDMQAVPVRDASGQIGKWLGVSTELTEHRALAQKLRDSELRLQIVLDNLTEGLVIVGLDGRTVYLNRAGLEMHGFSEGEEAWVPERFQRTFEMLTLDDRLLGLEEWPVPRILGGQKVSKLELRVRRKDKPWERVFSFNGAIVHEPNGEPLVFLTATDLTERHEALAAAQRSAETLRIANEAAGIGTYEADVGRRTARLSVEMCKLLGVDENTELPFGKAVSFMEPGEASKVERLFQSSLDPTGGGFSSADIRVTHPDGHLLWLRWSNKTFFRETTQGQVPVRCLGACVDITSLRRAQRRLTTQNAVSTVLANSQNLSEATPRIMEALCESEEWDLGAIWEVDSQAGVLRCAEVWHRPQLQLGELVARTRALEFARGTGLPGHVWASEKPVLVRNIAEVDNYLRAPLALKVGLTSALAFPVVLRGQVTGVIDFLGRNIHETDDALLDMFVGIGAQLGQFFARKRGEAERRQLEEQLLQAQKIEAIGQLSGGIAHDFNNILAAIAGNVHLALDEVGDDARASESLREIANATARAKNLVQQILTFARQQPVERTLLDLRLVAEESVRLLRATIPAGIELILSSPEDLPRVLGDPTQLEQVILNLGTNAWHALGSGTGTIDIRLRCAVLDEHQARALSGVRPGQYVQLSIRDTGIGMDSGTLERIFEPFFTTKTPGHGTGLGLSVVHGIVQNHDGAIAVKSKPGGGTNFDLYFPIASADAPRPSAIVPKLRSGHSEQILYLDDDPVLANVAKRILQRLGYRVTACTRASVALDAFRSDPGQFSAVITDMNMPELSGLEVANEVLSISPDTPVILTSGYITEEIKGRAFALGVREVVYKPNTAEELSEILNRVLNEPRTESASGRVTSKRG